ncbi:c-type cytochrome [Aliamphritea spongicola]|uniref:c-type cytochrome n=1 Tax=Aliamphritea spongicola TaxID=707589 RepID=UPI00196ACE3A|nr:cytochrome c [Aliamphritea spongicola]MBN3561586.1 cytochrome c [Aliamphritea spongicola]
MNRIALTLALTFIALTVRAEQPATEERQALFEQIEDGTEMLEKMINRRNMAESAQQAKAMLLKVEMLKTLFPEDSRGEGRSREKVWDNWDDFSSRLAALETAYQDAYLAASESNFGLAKSAFETADGSCRSCHMKYRSLW